MKKIKYVLGSQWGDEGKGKTVQYLCQEAINKGLKPLVVRYCSGPQASHTVMYNGITHVCSSFGSGVLLNVPTLIYEECKVAVDPIALHAEYDVLVQKGLNPKFHIDGQCSIITPYDVIANRNNEDSLNNGTCGCGVWEAINRINQSLCLESIWDCVLYPEQYLYEVRKYYNVEKQEELESKFLSDLNWLKDKVISWEDSIEYAKKFDVLIYESSQGLLLDGTFGLKPYITPCELLPEKDRDGSFMFSLFEEEQEVELYLCTRTYTTRHGAGYIPKESDYIKYPAFEANKNNQYQGQFKTGILDIDMINRAIDRHCLDNIENCKFNLVINHVDCIGSMFEYIYQGRVHIVPDFDAVTRIQNLINLKFDKVLVGKSPLSEFEVK